MFTCIKVSQIDLLPKVSSFLLIARLAKLPDHLDILLMQESRVMCKKICGIGLVKENLPR